MEQIFITSQHLDSNLNLILDCNRPILEPSIELKHNSKFEAHFVFILCERKKLLLLIFK